MVAERAAARGPRSAPERVTLAAALGRVLAEPLYTDRDQPPFPRSTRDGYAVKASEAAAHLELKIAGSTRAGQAPGDPLAPGTAWEIMTGAPVPAGADAVVMLEHVNAINGAIRVRAPRTLDPGENIVAQGAEAHAADEVLAAGTRIGPAQIALAAACGCATVSVCRRPRVMIMTTGDELVEVSQTPGPGQIRNSNAAMLAALVERAGGEPWILPPARDNQEALDEALKPMARADMALISGGVSAGKFDLVEPALARMGATFHFTGVRIQPGKPLVFGEVTFSEDTAGGDFGFKVVPFFGLPGNPISSAATFLLFGAQILAALAGRPGPEPKFVLARMARSIKGRPDLTRFVPSRCEFGPEGPIVGPTPSQGSGDLVSFARSNCFLMIPEGTERLEKGDLARILLVEGDR